MDAVELEKRVTELLTRRASVPVAHGNLSLQTIFDRAQHHYALVVFGRDGIRRVHGCLAHVEIRDDAVWIHRDGTEQGVARELLEAGVPKEQIILAFNPPEFQRLEQGAVA